mmetsp:Transcript_4478/g.9006  ORF Transcript_4478/g.9006 Transcript_4478/m.9006 type:complete len:112 (-) Transcript_4478:2252-2587(-)
MAQPAGAAAALPYVHPISDGVFLKMQQPSHKEGTDETWPAFDLLAHNFANNIQAGYVLEREPIARHNIILALGHPLARVIMDQERIYSFLVNAVAHYASTDCLEIPRNSPH